MNADAVRRRLRQRSDELGIDFQQAIQSYATERFLYRLSRSSWAEQFVVKGAVMLRVWDAALARPTQDIDFLGRLENTPDAVRDAVLACLHADASDDGLRFANDVVQAMLDDRYPGVRARIRGDFAGARFTLRLDVGIGDAVVPPPGWVDYPTLLDQPSPRILAYDPATAVAEKLEAAVSLGLVNSRMKDFYDLWMLAGTLLFDGQTLANAIAATLAARRTVRGATHRAHGRDAGWADGRVRSAAAHGGHVARLPLAARHVAHRRSHRVRGCVGPHPGLRHAAGEGRC